MNLFKAALLAKFLCFTCASVQAVEVRFRRAAVGMYAHIGDSGALQSRLT